MKSILKRTFSWQIPSYLYLLTIAFFLVFIMFISARSESDNKGLSEIVGKDQPENCLSSVKYIRSRQYDLTRPLLMTESLEAPASMIPLQNQISNEINNQIKLGNIGSASVFLRDLDIAGAVTVNAAESYNPGSMMKIPVMITCLKVAMSDKTFLLKRVFFNGHDDAVPVEEGSVPVLKKGNYYTVKELIQYMIINSDNDAMALLYNIVGQTELNKVFSELGIKIPPLDAPAFNMNPVEFSRMLLVLFNATYLDAYYSEFALSVLSKSKYDNGIIRSLPTQMPIAHKYGVAFAGDTKMLSESAIVYAENTTYLLVVMTKGHDYNKQSDVISDISNIVYNSFSGKVIN